MKELFTDYDFVIALESKLSKRRTTIQRRSGAAAFLGYQHLHFPSPPAMNDERKNGS